MSSPDNKHLSRRDFLGGAMLASASGLLGVPSRPSSHLAQLLRPASERAPETTTLRILVEDWHDHAPALGRSAHSFHSSTLAHAGSWRFPHGRAAAALGPTAATAPETTKIRALQFPASCQAPLYVAEGFLREEGFTDVRYVRTEASAAGFAEHLTRRNVDIGMAFVALNIIGLEAGLPVTILAGGHIGCFELLGSNRIRGIPDLKGRAVAVATGLGGPEHVFLSTMLAHVGLNPSKDVNWVTLPQFPTVPERFAESARLLAKGEIDGFLAFPPDTRELRAKKIGHVVVNSAKDRPWSQYFCCLIIAHREFVRANPVATKRAVRAILKGADFIGRDPARAAELLAAKFQGGDFRTHRDYARQLMQEIPYGKWRDYDPEDTIRFYALRLREAGMIKSSPQKIIAQGTDWRFLNEIKREFRSRGGVPRRNAS